MVSTQKETIKTIVQIDEKCSPPASVSLYHDGAFSSFQYGMLTIEQMVNVDISGNGERKNVNYGMIGELISDLMEKMDPAKFWELIESSAPRGYKVPVFEKKEANDE